MPHPKNDELYFFFEDVDDAQINIDPAKFQVITHYSLYLRKFDC